MASYVGKGDVIDHAPASALSAGQPVLVGSSLLTIATQPIAANAVGAVAVGGVWDIAKGVGNGTSVAAGASLYWDNANAVVTTSSNGTVACGYAVSAAANAASSVQLKLNG